MALSGDVLGDAIKAAVDAQAGVDPTDRTALFRAIGGAIVTHITASAVVNTTLAVASVTLVTPGVGSSGPGTGTGVGTVS